MNEPRTELRAILSVGLTEHSAENLQSCYPWVQECVAARGGWLFRRELEGLWCSFPSLSEAVRAAYELFQNDPTGQYGFSFGLHVGDVTITPEGDVLGHVLSVAKRLETSTPAGSLLMSKEAADRLESLPDDLQAESLSSWELKGVGRQEARRLTFPPIGLCRSLSPAEWESLGRGELVVCVVGPLGGSSELNSLYEQWGASGFFYEVAEDREAEVGRPSLNADFQRWCEQRPPLPEVESALANPSIPCLCFFPDPRLAHGTCLGQDVLTEADLDSLWSRLSEVLVGWETALTAHAVFWVGPSEWVELFHREIRRRFPAGPEQTQFLIDLDPPGPDQGAAELARWKKRGFRVYRGLEPLTELATRLAKPASPSHSTRVESDSPYRFLDSFGPRDRAIFFGRDRESALLRSWILTRRWLVLFGRSGVGKSSLLGAGVYPWLEENGAWIWTVRCLADPIEQLRTLCGESDVLAGIRRQAGNCPRRLVLVFDQFEEFFVHLTASERAPLAELLKKLASHPDLTRLHMLFSLREDFLAELASLEDWIPTLLDSRFRLTALTREQARQSILGPAALFDLEIEDALVEELLSELESQGVEPPELQIVMDRLWRSREGSRLSLESYRSLGGVRSILLGYLHESLEGALARGSWSRELPRQVMRALVSERNTKAAQTLKAVLQRVEGQPEEICEILDRLVDLRLARKVGGAHEIFYELSHEYLIEEIQSWASEAELALRHARMVLQSELESWESLGSLISPDRLTMVVRELPHQLVPTSAEYHLLLRASMIHGIELGMSGDGAAPVLLGMLDENWDGWVQRRVLARLARGPLEEQAQRRFLEAAQRFSHPGLLQELRESLIENHGELFYQALEAATRGRFFGPQAMTRVPAGPAWLGSTAANRAERKALLPKYWHARIDSEPELAQVELDSYWIDIVPVTNLEFAEFRPAHLDRYPDEEDDHPVVSVRWHDAQEYARWLGKQLVCEARWEKAARGSQGNLYPWGNEYEPTFLNGQEKGSRSTSLVKAHGAGASPYGCLDMAGNIWEWTASDWSPGGPFKVQKGGSTLNAAPLQQCSTRMEAFPDFVLQWVGFRLMSLEGP